jgi:hypothetical protein
LAGIDADVTHELVADEAGAERLGFPGSPSILIDDDDPFATSGVALACRFYVTPEGRDTAPSVEQLREAIENAGA